MGFQTHTGPSTAARIAGAARSLRTARARLPGVAAGPFTCHACNPQTCQTGARNQWQSLSQGMEDWSTEIHAISTAHHVQSLHLPFNHSMLILILQ
jgi:hypothetical protein